MSTHSKKQLYVFSNIGGYLVMLIINGLANILPINGKTTGALSDAYPNLFVPAGITFSIWGVIYLLLALLMFYQLYTLFRHEVASGLYIIKIGWWFAISCLLNIAWIFAWHYEVIGLSLIIMLMLLATLIMIHRRLDVGGCCTTLNEKIFVFVPFSLYLGWISVATVANATVLLVSLDWGRWGLSEVFWFIIILAAIAGLTLVMIFRKKDIVYALAIIWALAGIIMKRSQGGAVQDKITVIAAVAAVVVITVAALIQIFRRKVYH
ncbi:MAG: hypothetical protein KBB71_02305 [Lentimicrobiaceae bacterium]|nr:hypothetical protein [Lentimicrobiaceae bacterium]